MRKVHELLDGISKLGQPYWVPGNERSEGPEFQGSGPPLRYGPGTLYKILKCPLAFVVLALGLSVCADLSRADEPVVVPPFVEQPRAETTKPLVQPIVIPTVEALKEPVEKVPPVVKPKSTPKRLKFNFRYQPWGDVLNWFAEQAGYSLVLDNPPRGTFNYRDDRAYTPAEAIDLLNSILLTKGHTLVLRDRMLMLVNLEDEIPPTMIARVSPEELDNRGKYELLSTRFQLKILTTEEAEKEVETLLGPQGKIVVLPKARQLVITEMGGRLREIRDVLNRAEGARDPAGQDVRWFELGSVSPDEAVAMLRQIFDIKEGANSTADGSLRLATDPIGFRLLVSGTPERLAQVAKILKTVDEPPHGETADTDRQAALQLEVYDTAPADPEAVLKVMQTLLADVPGVRLATDPKTGNLIALARPKEQATVRATIDQLRRDAQSVEVIGLRVVDPQLAVLAIGKLFGGDSDKAPSVDADVANRQLLIRGSVGQITQIRALLEKMGETFGTAPTLAGGKLRLVPVHGDDAHELLDRIREFWPVVGGNELRMVPTRGPRQPGSLRQRPSRLGPIDERTPVPGAVGPSVPSGGDGLKPSTTREHNPAPPSQVAKGRIRFASAAGDQVDTAATPMPKSNPEKAPILVLPTPNGLYFSSEDTEALDKLQELIETLQGGDAVADEPKLTVFYLRNAEAKTVAERLKELLADTTTAPATGGNPKKQPEGILGNLGSAGTFGHITPSGPVSVIPDPRLNALLVQAAPADVDLIEEVLRILDRRGSPEEVPAQPKPRLIPVLHTSATEIATVVKEVYQNRLEGGGSGNQPPSPHEMMMRMFRGRRGGRDSRSSGANASQESLSKMTIGVDSRTNSLIVSAPETLFEEVRELVNALDRVASQDQETVEVVRLHESNPEAVSAALASLLGDAVENSTVSGTGQSSGATGSRRNTGNMPGFSFPFNRNWRGSQAMPQGGTSRGNRTRSRQPSQRGGRR